MRWDHLPFRSVYLLCGNLDMNIYLPMHNEYEVLTCTNSECVMPYPLWPCDGGGAINFFLVGVKINISKKKENPKNYIYE